MFNSPATSCGPQVVSQFCGHFIGSELHMLPNVSHVPNSLALELLPGMTFTIEPIFVEASVEEIITFFGFFDWLPDVTGYPSANMRLAGKCLILIVPFSLGISRLATFTNLPDLLVLLQRSGSMHTLQKMRPHLWPLICPFILFPSSL